VTYNKPKEEDVTTRRCQVKDCNNIYSVLSVSSPLACPSCRDNKKKVPRADIISGIGNAARMCITN
jgi:hypothetical protein